MRKWIATIIVLMALIGVFFLMGSQRTSDPVDQTPPVADVMAQEDLRALINEPAPIREAKPDEAQLAMDMFGLWVPEGTTDWAIRTGKNGNYVLEDFVFERENIIHEVARLEITGVRLVSGGFPYFDRLELSGIFGQNEDGTQSVKAESFIIKMPEPESLLMELPGLDPDDIDTPFQYLELAMKMDPEDFGIYPELIAENVKWTENSSYRDWSQVPEELEFKDVVRVSPNLIDVEDVTEFGFIGLTKIDRRDAYNFQMHNFNFVEHSPLGVAAASSIASVTILDFKCADFAQLTEDAASKALYPPNETEFDPQFQSISAQGIELNIGFDTLNVDQINIWNNDRHSDNYVQTVSLPRINYRPGQIPDAMKSIGVVDNPLRAYGFDDTTMSFNARVNYNAQSRTIDVEEWQFSMAGEFDLNVRYQLKNWDETAFLYLYSGLAVETIDEESGETISVNRPAISGVHMEFTDHGLLDRIHNNLMEEGDLTLEEAKTISKVTISGMVAENLTDAQNEVMTSAEAALSRLVEQGGALKFSMRPFRDITVEEFSRVLRNRLYAGPSYEDQMELAEQVKEQYPDDYQGFLEQIEANKPDPQIEAERRRKTDDLIRAMNVSIVHIP